MSEQAEADVALIKSQISTIQTDVSAMKTALAQLIVHLKAVRDFVGRSFFIFHTL